MVKIDLGLYSIVMKYAHRPSSGKTIYYLRRIPKGFESHYDVKTFCVKTTGTIEPKLAATILMRLILKLKETGIVCAREDFCLF